MERTIRTCMNTVFIALIVKGHLLSVLLWSCNDRRDCQIHLQHATISGMIEERL